MSLMDGALQYTNHDIAKRHLSALLPFVMNTEFGLARRDTARWRKSKYICLESTVSPWHLPYGWS